MFAVCAWVPAAHQPAGGPFWLRLWGPIGFYWPGCTAYFPPVAGRRSSLYLPGSILIEWAGAIAGLGSVEEHHSRCHFTGRNCYPLVGVPFFLEHCNASSREYVMSGLTIIALRRLLANGGLLSICRFLRCRAAKSLYCWGPMAAVNQRYCAPWLAKSRQWRSLAE